MLYRELVNKAIIRNDNLVDIFISSIPFGVRVRWESSGKMEKYNVDVSIVDVLVKTAQHGSGYAISIHI